MVLLVGVCGMYVFVAVMKRVLLSPTLIKRVVIETSSHDEHYYGGERNALSS